MKRRPKPAKKKAPVRRTPTRRTPAPSAKIRALAEAHAQQRATSEILRVIASSPADLQPVLDTVVRSAARLCECLDAAIFRVDGDGLRIVAHDGTIPPVRPVGSLVPSGPGLVNGRAIRDGRTIHVPDLQAAADEFPEGSAQARRLGWRATLAVPLRREGTVVGTIAVRRVEARPFSDSQIALLETFADQAVIAIENVRRVTELKEALGQQTATSEILRVISASRTDVQPVFDAIVESAVRLLRGHTSTLTRIADGQILLVALTTTSDPASDAALRARYPQPLDSEEGHGQAIRARAPVNIGDAHTDPRLPDAQRASARLRGFRSLALVPLLRQGEAIGAIGVSRREPGEFTGDEIALLQTFADQAVIAIENARLLSELQEKNESLSEALEQQTATSEILRVISQSPTSTEPVFDTIIRSAVRLCRGATGALYRFDGERFHVGAACNFAGPEWDQWLSTFPRPVGDGGGLRVTVETGRVLNVPDAEQGTVLTPASRQLYRAIGIRSLLFVPMARQEQIIGVIVISHRSIAAFADAHIDLLTTFADQAMIAIENVRLFTELQTSNHDLTTALDTQTATADILRVISRSQIDVLPVFQAIVDSAQRLLRGNSSVMSRIVEDRIVLAAYTRTGATADALLESFFPIPLHPAQPDSRPIREGVIGGRVPYNVADTETDARVGERGRTNARARGYRSQLVVPMLRQDEAIGTIAVTRREPGAFTEDEIALLQTFADQAVIAIENARLLSELQARTADLTRSVGELRALGEIGQAIGSTLELQTVLATIAARATQLAGADAGVIYEYDTEREVFEPRATDHLDPEIVQALAATPMRRGQGVTGRLADVLEPIQVADVRVVAAQVPVRDALIRAGYRALLAVPLMREDQLIGGLTVFRKTPGEYAGNVIELMQTFATQSALAILNARLFREIEIKSRELEVASQHKSEFLASMSHELRTPLNAIIGFSDVLLQGMFGETNEKQTEYLRDILASGQHLLSLINDILDLSKIEAGRMDLDLGAFDLPTAIDDALLLMRERAERRGIALERQLDERLGEVQADQRKVKQVLLNLLSNAVKFTPEGGRIDVRAALADGTAEVSVTDTGIGIAPEDHEAVFEEFRQVGKAEKKAEGTGLGLALCRKFVELHGGRIWVTSQLGGGSTFTFSLPLARA